MQGLNLTFNPRMYGIFGGGNPITSNRGSAQSPVVSPKVNWGQQNKHIPDTNNYIPGRSMLSAEPERLAEFAGTGQQVGKLKVGMPGSKERVDFGFTIGTWIGRDGQSAETTRGIIIYGKNGIHIVPARPN